MRRFLVGAATAAILVASAGGAHAGASWLETERSAYAVGDHAVASGTFGSGTHDGKVADGPFYAYLIRGDRSITPGPIPASAIPLGPLSITPARGNECCWVARVEFTVPDVPAGQYRLGYCNDPCTVHGIGDLEGGSFFVNQSSEEARLFQKIGSLNHRIERLRSQRSRLAERAASLQRDLEAANAVIASAAARQASPLPPETRRPLLPWALAVVFAALAIVLRLGARRRIRVPDFVPPELRGQVEDVAQLPSRQPTTSVGRPAMVRASPGSSGSGASPVTKS